MATVLIGIIIIVFSFAAGFIMAFITEAKCRKDQWEDLKKEIDTFREIRELKQQAGQH